MDSIIQRGIKRKRYEPPQEELSVRIKGKLHHELKEVRKAAKRAKLYETQKVVKKLKDLGKKGDNSQVIGEYEAELASLKGTEHDSIGNTALKTKLLKDRTLRENEEIMTAMNKELEGPFIVPAEPGTVVAKIQSRLLSSKILSIQAATSLEALKVLLNPALKQNEPENNASDKAVQRPLKLQKETSMSTFQAVNLTAKAPSMADQDADVDINDAGWESGSIDEGGVENLTDDEWESGENGPKEYLEDENQDSESELKVKSKSRLSKPPGKPAKSSSSINESTFLPSLSVGFIRGGSDDSDWSETEGKGTDLEPKKNRRGQRARRAIWEKKFGRNAHHKKKEEEANAQARKIGGRTSTIKGSDTSPAKGAALYWKNNFSQIHQPADAGWSTRTVGASTTSIVTPAGTDRPLHPSWEAKRRLKEKQSMGIVPSQGKKIKFS